MARQTRFELVTHRFVVCYSIQLSYWRTLDAFQRSITIIFSLMVDKSFSLKVGLIHDVKDFLRKKPSTNRRYFFQRNFILNRQSQSSTLMDIFHLICRSANHIRGMISEMLLKGYPVATHHRRHVRKENGRKILLLSYEAF